MITKDIAINLKVGDILYYDLRLGTDKRPWRAKVNGKIQTWKTRPDVFRLPMKRGLYDTFQLWNDSDLAEHFHVNEHDAIEAYNARLTK